MTFRPSSPICLVGDDDRVHGTLPVFIAPTEKGTVDSQIALANRTLACRLREWASHLDAQAEVIENR